MAVTSANKNVFMCNFLRAFNETIFRYVASHVQAKRSPIEPRFYSLGITWSNSPTTQTSGLRAVYYTRRIAHVRQTENLFAVPDKNRPHQLLIIDTLAIEIRGLRRCLNVGNVAACSQFFSF